MMENFNPAFSQGESAFFAGVALEDNPHPVGSESGDRWANGWNFARETKDMPPPMGPEKAAT